MAYIFIFILEDCYLKFWKQKENRIILMIHYVIKRYLSIVRDTHFLLAAKALALI